MRKEKNRTRYSISLSEYSIDNINKISASTGIKKTRIMDKALKLSFNEYENNKIEFLMSGCQTGTSRACFSTSLDKEDIKRLEVASQDVNLNKGEFVERGLISLFKIYENDKMLFLKI